MKGYDEWIVDNPPMPAPFARGRLVTPDAISDDLELLTLRKTKQARREATAETSAVEKSKKRKQDASPEPSDERVIKKKEKNEERVKRKHKKSRNPKNLDVPGQPHSPVTS